MAAAGDIVWISIPFTAGVATAALVPTGPVRCGIMCAACATVPILFAILCGKGPRKAAACMLFYCLGVLCLLGHETASAAPASAPVWISAAMDRLCAHIDSIGFEGEQTAALVKALLTGRRESLARDTVQLFRASGGAHILALSGLHLGVLYGLMTRLLAFMGNSRTAGILRSVAIVLASGCYTALTGASASIVRAFLFISINETLRHCPGRRRDALGVFFSALMIQLVFCPPVIRSLGFQLSYLAMLGIFTIYPLMEGWYPESFSFDLPRKIWKSAALSLSCQTLTAPLVWFKFRTFPKFFLMTNLIAMPLSELLMISSVACILGSVAGICPDIMKSPVDFLARTLIFCLETISTM